MIYLTTRKEIVMIWVPIIIIIVFGAAAAFWNGISDFMLRTLLPWCKNFLPTLEPLVRTVFRAVDKVMVPIARAIREGWEKLKTWLIGQLAYYERKSVNVYVEKICKYFRTALEGDQSEKIVEEVTTRQINPLEIPDEFRERVLGLEASQINLTKHVDEAAEQIVLEAEG